MVWVSGGLHGYGGRREEKERYLSEQMSARVGKCPIGIHPARVIEWRRSRSVCLPLALRSQQFESTCPGNQSIKVWITFNQWSDRIRTGCVEIHRSGGIEWCRFRSIRMAVEVRMEKEADTSVGRCPQESERV